MITIVKLLCHNWMRQQNVDVNTLILGGIQLSEDTLNLLNE